MRRMAERLADYLFADHLGAKGTHVLLAKVMPCAPHGDFLCSYEKEAVVRAFEEVLANVPDDWEEKLGEGFKRKLADACRDAGVEIAGKWLAEAALEAVVFQAKTIDALNRKVAELLPAPASVPPPVVSDPDFVPPPVTARSVACGRCMGTGKTTEVTSTSGDVPCPICYGTGRTTDGTYPNSVRQAGAREKGHGA